jgi:Peptidase family C25
MKTIKILLLLITFFMGSKSIQAQNYDYLIIVPDIFLQNATWDNDLISLQISKELHPVIATVQLGYTNEQIKNIIEYYYNSNPIKYVLLMGSGENLEIPQGEVPNVPYE